MAKILAIIGDAVTVEVVQELLGQGGTSGESRSRR